MRHATRRIAPLVIFSLLAAGPPATAGAQFATPVAAAAAAPSRSANDSIPGGRRVRSLPVTMGGALGGGVVGALVGGGIGALVGGQGDALAEFVVGTAVGATIGYGIGAGVGAHLAASTAPRPGILPTVGVSFLGAAAGALVALAIDNASGRESDAQDVITVLAVPAVHLTLTSLFARRRARTAP